MNFSQRQNGDNTQKSQKAEKMQDVFEPHRPSELENRVIRKSYHF